MEGKLSVVDAQSTLNPWVNLHAHLKLHALDAKGDIKKQVKKLCWHFFDAFIWHSVISMSEMRCEHDTNSSATAFPTFYQISPTARPATSTINSMCAKPLRRRMVSSVCNIKPQRRISRWWSAMQWNDPPLESHPSSGWASGHAYKLWRLVVKWCGGFEW